MSKGEAIRDGLTIMLKYGKVETCAEHDEFFAHPDGENEGHDTVSEKDQKKLDELGWRKNEDVGGWSIFT